MKHKPPKPIALLCLWKGRPYTSPAFVVICYMLGSRTHTHAKSNLDGFCLQLPLSLVRMRESAMSLSAATASTSISSSSSSSSLLLLSSCAYLERRRFNDSRARRSAGGEICFHHRGSCVFGPSQRSTQVSRLVVTPSWSCLPSPLAKRSNIHVLCFPISGAWWLNGKFGAL